ncbi:MAG: IS21-like element helper ATPase IstB [Desulfobacteraceae bacterium]|nr:IS21-like element helper ATPase IstB [Desulfobacteraceae bacterium]
MKAYKDVLDLASILGLKGFKENIDALIQEAEAQKISYLSFLQKILLSEVSDRAKKRLHRNFTGARLPVEKQFKTYKFERVEGITQKDIANLVDCSWLDRHENILLFGPPGIGKTHIAIALGMNCLAKGYTVCFERVTNLMRLLKMAGIQKSAEFRLNRIMKANLIIIDEIGYTPIDRKEANMFFNLVSEVYEKSSIIITSNKSFENWAEMLGDQVMTTALLDRLLHHAKIFNMNGDSYRLPKKIKKEESSQK